MRWKRRMTRRNWRSCNARAFITHGGVNSLHEGLYYSVPEIVVLHQLEQDAQWQTRGGDGRGRTAGARPHYGRVSARQRRDALDALLSKASYRKNARRVGKTLKAAEGYWRATMRSRRAR
jgi:UDP:flavonoid glycosyltransferase YjiC (YdhE family)